MEEVEEFILKHDSTQRDCMLFFHQLFLQQYSLRPKLSYGIPFYYGNRWVVYLNPTKRKTIELAFTNGYLFPKFFRQLESKGRKMIRSIEYHNLAEINQKEVEKWMEQALIVDQTFSKKK